MNIPGMPWLLVLILALLVVLWAGVALAQRYRTVCLGSLSGQLRLRILARDPLGLPQRYGQMYLFQHGHAHRARNVMIGHVGGRPIRAFDYLYETGLGLDRRTQQFSVVMVQANRDLPILLIRSVADGESGYNLTGLAEIGLGGAGAELGYAVYCQENEFAESRVTAQMLGKLKQHKNANLELYQGMLTLYCRGKLNGTEYRELMGLGSKFVEYFTANNLKQDKS